MKSHLVLDLQSVFLSLLAHQLLKSLLVVSLVSLAVVLLLGTPFLLEMLARGFEGEGGVVFAEIEDGTVEVGEVVAFLGDSNGWGLQGLSRSFGVAAFAAVDTF